jgi:hypothetical protein
MLLSMQDIVLYARKRPDILHMLSECITVRPPLAPAGGGWLLSEG